MFLIGIVLLVVLMWVVYFLMHASSGDRYSDLPQELDGRPEQLMTSTKSNYRGAVEKA